MPDADTLKAAQAPTSTSGFQLDTSGVVRVPLPFKVTYTSHVGSPTFNPRTGETRYRTTRYFPTEAEALAFCGGRKSMVKRTSGGVSEAHRPFTWSDLTPFCQGYIEAMLASVVGVDPGDRMPRGAGFSDLAPATLSRIIADCELVAERTGWTQLDEAAGREAWRLRQECTAFYGLWPITVTLGDDGLIYLTEAGQ